MAEIIIVEEGGEMRFNRCLKCGEEWVDNPGEEQMPCPGCGILNHRFVSIEKKGG